MKTQNKETRIILAIQTIQSSKKLNRRSAAKLYNIPESTLRDRMAGRAFRRKLKANCYKLTELEKKVIVQYILNIDSQGFPPQLLGMENIANLVLSLHQQKPIGTYWVQRFVQQYPELKTYFSRIYNFQRALYKDPELIKA